MGAGLQLALGADIRVAAQHAHTQFGLFETRYGIIPDMGISVTAAHVLRRDALLLLAASGEPVGADEALALGLVTKLVDADRAGDVDADGVLDEFDSAESSGESSNDGGRRATLAHALTLALQIASRSNESVRAGEKACRPRVPSRAEAARRSAQSRRDAAARAVSDADRPTAHGCRRTATRQLLTQEEMKLPFCNY